MNNGNGNVPAVMFVPTHKSRVWYVSAKVALIKESVIVSGGRITAEKGDIIVKYGNGATTVMKPDFFAANFEEIKTEKEEVDERDIVSVINALKEDENE